VIEQLTSDLESTKKELQKYKEILVDQIEDHAQNEPDSRNHDSPQITTRQTIPSERAHLDDQMRRYGKENVNFNILKHVKKDKLEKHTINLSELSSLNVSKSTMNAYGEIGSPSVSTLTCRADENDDFSFQFSSANLGEAIRDKLG
jgi:hypothetical protein